MSFGKISGSAESDDMIPVGSTTFVNDIDSNPCIDDCANIVVAIDEAIT